jgi:predicted anti-sigma-YlaC factor YlaD
MKPYEPGWRWAYWQERGRRAEREFNEQAKAAFLLGMLLVLTVNFGFHLGRFALDKFFEHQRAEQSATDSVIASALIRIDAAKREVWSAEYGHAQVAQEIQLYQRRRHGRAALPNPRGPIFSMPSTMGSWAAFEAFPANGWGTSGVCSPTAPTARYLGAPVALTFTRASSATCTKTASGGLATTGIANGDLVLLTNDQSRVEYDSAGTLGLLVESARTNINLRSEEIDNAWWTSLTAGAAAAPVLNGTCAASPLASPGSMPEDYTFGATAAGEDSGRIGSNVGVTCNSAACTHSIFVQGVSGAGTLDLCGWDTVAPTCTACSYVQGSWTRCTHTSTKSGNIAIFIGNNTLWNGGTVRATNRVCVTGGQVELGAYATSYIPTVAAATTRVVESASFPIALTTGSDFSLAVSGQASGFSSAGCAGNTIWSAVPGPYLSTCFGGIGYGGVTATATTGTNFGAGVIAGWRAGSEWIRATNTSRVIVDGALGGTSTNAGVLSAAWGAFTLGTTGIHSRICADPSPTRCR